MATHGSATVRETPHETETTQITISDALRRRAQSVINDRSIDPQWRNIVRYALEINDPWLADIVRRAGAGEKIIDSTDFSLEPQFDDDDSNEEKIETLADIICRANDEAAAALFVLMGTLENCGGSQTTREHSHQPSTATNLVCAVQPCAKNYLAVCTSRRPLNQRSY